MPGPTVRWQYVAVCDLDSKRLAQGKQTIENLNRQKNRQSPPEIATYTKYEDLLARRDIDAVVISLPDHQHAEVCLAAIRRRGRMSTFRSHSR